VKYVYVPERKYRELRHLAKLRWRYSKGVVATKNRMKGIYLFEGIIFPEGKWSIATIAGIKGLRSHPAVKFKVEQLLEDLNYYRKKELKVLAELRHFCKEDDADRFMNRPDRFDLCLR
jgi:hypothetical protein